MLFHTYSPKSWENGPPWEQYLVQSSHSLSKLGFNFRQCLCPLQGLLQFLFGLIQTLLQLPVLLLTLGTEKQTHNRYLWALRLTMGWPWRSEIFSCLTANTTRVNNFITAADGYWSVWDKLYLSVQGLLACQLIFQLVFDVMERSRLPLGTEIPTCNTNHSLYSIKLGMLE